MKFQGFSETTDPDLGCPMLKSNSFVSLEGAGRARQFVSEELLV